MACFKRNKSILPFHFEERNCCRGNLRYHSPSLLLGTEFPSFPSRTQDTEPEPCVAYAMIIHSFYMLIKKEQRRNSCFSTLSVGATQLDVRPPAYLQNLPLSLCFAGSASRHALCFNASDHVQFVFLSEPAAPDVNVNVRAGKQTHKDTHRHTHIHTHTHTEFCV